MAILSGVKKVRRYIKESNGYRLLSQWTSSQTVEMNNGTTLESNKAGWDAAKTHANSVHAPSNAEKNTITGVKGNAESVYRTGNISLSPADIGAAAYAVSTSDFNNMTTPGLYTMRSTSTNAPTSGSYHSLIVLKSDTGTYVQQIAIKEGTTDVYVRYGSSSSWGTWVKLSTANDSGSSISASTIIPKVAGTASIGTDSGFAKGDHVHPAQTTVSGNAGSATKLATARNINGISFDGSANRFNYGTCSTAASTVAKTVSCTGFTLATGSEITVKFIYANTAANPTLNVNSTGTKAIYYNGSAITSGLLVAKGTYTFRYNGTQWDLVGSAGSSGKDYADKAIYVDNVVSMGRIENPTIGYKSFAFGTKVDASGSNTFSVGYETSATGIYSFAEGLRTTVLGPNSHAEGVDNTIGINGSCCHAEGTGNIVNGIASHVMGFHNNATTSNSLVCGQYNADKTALFIIGCGNNDSARANAFSVQLSGIVKAKSTITGSTTADYAEFFEWEDGNPNKEDRVGKFVTIKGDKISIAKSNESYILGIVSGEPFVLGNGDCDTWNGMYLKDEFNRTIYEPAPKVELDVETGQMIEIFEKDGTPVYEGTRPKLNPDYDPNQPYISRFDRKEWAPVGMLGVLSVIHDGTCKVNGYCCCNSEGIATACDMDTKGACRVIQKMTDNVVRVILK